MATASAQPVVITIQPDFSALDLASNTPATTPLPSRISSAVPTSSAVNILIAIPSLVGRIGQSIPTRSEGEDYSFAGRKKREILGRRAEDAVGSAEAQLPLCSSPGCWQSTIVFRRSYAPARQSGSVARALQSLTDGVSLRRLRTLAARQARTRLGLEDLRRLGFGRLRRLGANPLGQRLSVHQELNFIRVQDLALEQILRDPDQRVAIRGEDVLGALVAMHNELLHFLVDLDRGVLAEVALGGEIPSQEDFLLVLAEGQGTQARHPEFAHHAAREFRRLLDVVAGAGGDVVQKHLFGHASAHHDGKLRLEIVLGVRVLVIHRQL